jgi:acyl carrier protein
MTNTFDGLREIIAKDFELPLERLEFDTPLEEMELDSLAVTELIFSLEDRFGVTANEPGSEFRTLGDIANYIDELVAERGAAEAKEPSMGSKSLRPAAITQSNSLAISLPDARR